MIEILDINPKLSTPFNYDDFVSIIIFILLQYAYRCEEEKGRSKEEGDLSEQQTACRAFQKGNNTPSCQKIDSLTTDGQVITNSCRATCSQTLLKIHII